MSDVPAPGAGPQRAGTWPRTDRVEIGLGLQSDKPAGEYARLARIAEQHEIDVISVFSDLMFQPPIFALLEMAAATERVRLGAACWNPYSMHPYEIAGQVAALDLASHGRAYLGLARGTWLGSVGIEQPRALAYLRESVGYVRDLLAGEAAGVEGSVFRRDAGVRLRYQVQRPHVPLLLGVWGPQASAVAGELADEVKIGGSANPALVDVMRERLAPGELRAGRAPGTTRVTLGAVTVVDEDGEKARAKARAEVAMYLAVVADLDPTVELRPGLLDEVQALVTVGDHAGAGALIPDDLLDLFAFSGSPEQVAVQAQRLIDAGAARIDFGTPQGLQDDTGIELIGSRVVPLLDRRPRPAADDGTGLLPTGQAATR
ncbi:LLM class flavin-dependent oxidoreductase [Blastococcus sp. VKM Ac-2987]|uniref:LLM class flavin-dependent oxidoreductase n=1 Tax=Blastococcus sp. VKM Ac-2987 TaxID=3004141 RepID=UPI0022ABAC9A|nr:LLM class flavin-dependent oxidoreductase [Blastococcus sp. VKM Ac-2987]MCZ2857570.1 LLM class flavin-dependent oxidoreductase [Blastococcus sp. VKM Ac-2987]